MRGIDGVKEAGCERYEMVEDILDMILWG